MVQACPYRKLRLGRTKGFLRYTLRRAVRSRTVINKFPVCAPAASDPMQIGLDLLEMASDVSASHSVSQQRRWS